MTNSETGRVEFSDYKGHPIINLFIGNETQSFNFGLRKAEKVLANIDEIREFVDKHRNPPSDAGYEEGPSGEGSIPPASEMP